MKVVFFGTSSFAASLLDGLFAEPEIEIVAVVTKVDVHQGRSLKLSPPPVKKYLLANRKSVPVFQPLKASSEEFVNILLDFHADLFIVVAYGEILSELVLAIPKKGCFNIHASLLPKYRGAAPIQRAILDGCAETGICIIEMVKKMDAGDVLVQKSVAITEEMNFAELSLNLQEAAKVLLHDFLHRIDFYKKFKIQQDAAEVTFAKKIESEELRLNWNEDVTKINNKIRAFSPLPGAYCYVQYGQEVKRLKILKAKVCRDIQGPYGSILARKNRFVIAGLGGSLEVQSLQLEGKNAMSADAFLCGAPLHLSIVM